MGLRLLEAVLVHEGARRAAIRDDLLGFRGVGVPGEEVERHGVVATVGEEALAPAEIAGDRGAADLQVGELALQVLGGRLVEAEEVGDGAAPAARVLREARVGRVEVRLVPDFPIDDVELVGPCDVHCRVFLVESPAPALVVVADHVLADPRPLCEVLRGKDAVLLGAVLDGLSEAEEHLRAGAADVVEVVVGEYEVVVLRVVLVGIEVGEDGVDVAGVRAAGDAVDRVVRAGEGDARGLVVLEVAAHLVAAGLLHGGAVVDGVHRLDRAELLAEVHGHEGRRGGLGRKEGAAERGSQAKQCRFHSFVPFVEKCPAPILAEIPGRGTRRGRICYNCVQEKMS